MRGTIKPGGIWGWKAGYEADFTKVENTGLWNFDTEDNHDLYISEKEIDFAPPKKEKRVGQEINLEDVQVGDTIVCFWEKNGVEYRQKGVVARIDEDGWAVSEGGNFITHKYANNNGVPAEHIYLLDRPTPKGFAALDKTKTYFLKNKNGILDWYLAYNEGRWRYGRSGDIATSAAAFERAFTSGEGDWEKPVECTPEPEVEDGFYRTATAKGQLYRALNNKLSVAFDGDGWQETRYIPERFIADIKAGELIRI